MISAFTLKGIIGLLLLLGTHHPTQPEPGPTNYYLDIESIAQRAYQVEDPGTHSELYFVYGSMLSDKSSQTHSAWSFMRNPHIQLQPYQTSRRRVPIISKQVLQPTEYIVVNIGVMDEDCPSTNRGGLARLFVPNFSILPQYRPGYVGGITPSWTGAMIGNTYVPRNDIRGQVPPPTIDLERLKRVTQGQCTLRGDDLQGYVSFIAWNNPFARPGTRMWDYHCNPSICQGPPIHTGDTLIVHMRHDNTHDITFRISMRGY